ncbi:MAG TPA: hypothetical protein VG055_12855 [Planctomycetaceae bacterium]|jgi:hypothetical protein|nr:hypothetical protein [Planctomycetaceae bacterium]
MDQQPETVKGPYEGILRLFEHHYNAETVFWHGIADIGCEAKEILQYAWGGYYYPQFAFYITLPDGRQGMARYLKMVTTHAPEATYVQVAVTGATDFQLLRA